MQTELDEPYHPLHQTLTELEPSASIQMNHLLQYATRGGTSFMFVL